jgi:hypothetical protein
VSRGLREAVADWLMLLGAIVLALSLFLAWSHQHPVGGAAAGIPRDPTGWQVYSVADVILAALAAALVYVSFLGTRRARAFALVLAAIGLAFVIHALGVPPTDGAFAAGSASAGSGAGEVVALVGLGVAIGGLALSFTAD